MWLTASLEKDGRVSIRAGSDSQITKGLCAVMVKALSGMTPQEILQVLKLAL